MSRLCSKSLLMNTSRVLFNNHILPQYPSVVTVRCLTTSPKSKQGIFKLGLMGVTVGALVGTGYSIRQLNKPNAHILNEQTKIPLVENVPKIQPSRKVSCYKRTFSAYRNSSSFSTDCHTGRSIWFKISTVSISNLPILL